MYLLVIILPLISFIITGLLGRYLGLKGVLRILNVNMLIITLISLLLIYEYYLEDNILIIELINKIKSDILDINIYLYFDNISQIMLITIILVSYLVIIYSYDYMINDPHIIRFLLYIILFVFFMIILISNNSLPIIFIGWEGVGVTSFLLITFWFTRFNTQLGGLIAILMNRIGDIFYILGILISLNLMGSLDIISINVCNNINYDILILMFFIAAMAKSAQIYLHLWLPYSMEGPTPISALIHAATMVTAGVYLLLKLNLLISLSYYSIFIITFIGSLTTFIGGSLAIISFDIKELIAYSTMSQLGYMITIIGLKGNNMSFYHLVFHAYFKALLFLTAGAIIHTIFDLQDFRKMGGLINLLPLQNICTLIGLMSLIGFPFTTGFYSKENLLNYSFSIDSLFSHYVYLILLISASFTIFYSYYFYIKIYFSSTKLSLFILKYNIHFFSKHLLIPLFLISFITIIFGFLFSKWIIIYNPPLSPFLFDYIPLFIKFIPFIFMIFIFMFILFVSLTTSFTSNISFNIFSQFYSFKFLYQFFSGFFFAISYRIFFKLFDYGFFDLIGPIFTRYLFNTNFNYYFINIHPIAILISTLIISSI